MPSKQPAKRRSLALDACHRHGPFPRPVHVLLTLLPSFALVRSLGVLVSQRTPLFAACRTMEEARDVPVESVEDGGEDEEEHRVRVLPQERYRRAS